MTTWNVETGSGIRTPLFFDAPSSTGWFVADDGRLRFFSLLDMTLSLAGSGWNDAIAALPCRNGLSVVIPLASGDVFIIPRDGADRSNSNATVSIDASLRSATRLDDDSVLILDEQGRVHKVEPVTGQSTVLLTGLIGATVLATDETTGELLIVADDANPTLHRFALNDGTPISSPEALPSRVRALVPSPNGPDLVLVDDTGSAAAYNPMGSSDGFIFADPLLHSLCRWHSLMIATAGSKITLFEWGTDVDLLPLATSPAPLVPGGWASVMSDLSGTGLAADDIDWRIEEGPHAATLSIARPAAGTGPALEIRVIAGPFASEFKLAGYARATNTLIATRRFRVLEHWPDRIVGPPMAITGSQRVYAKPGWGGGPAGPQNIPADDEYRPGEQVRIAAAVFRTKGANSTINAQARIAQLQNDIIGPGQSAKTYYEEVSYRATPGSSDPSHPKGTTLELLGGRVFGPIDLNYTWAELFDTNEPDSDWGPWHPKGGTWDVLAGTLSTHLLDLGLQDSVTKLADSVILMVLPATDDPYTVAEKKWPAQWTWAFASDAQVYWKDEFSATFTRCPAVVMPAAMPANYPSPWPAIEWVSCICHELAHNLGCPDLYNLGAYPPEVVVRDVESWDLMSVDSPLPHLSLPHRMRLGWIYPNWIEVCDFGKNPASRTVRLHAVEALTRSGPPSGRKAGVEIRIRDGWNYYFEFRRRQAGQIGDQRLPANSAIFGCDVDHLGVQEITRPLILRLPPDVDGDGPVLRRAGQDYQESDVTNPERMNDFRLTRLASTSILSDPNEIAVEIEYIGAHRPELQIQPAPGGNNFKSPDIDIDGPAGPNIVVKGKKNTVRVKVHNRGTKGANNVQLRVWWLPFTTAPGVWNPLPNPPTQTVPAHSERDFYVDWDVPESVVIAGVETEHFCIRAEVDRYVDPSDPAGNEIVVHNNSAQSNFNTSAVGHASPSERRTTAVSSTNILPMQAVHRTLLEQSNQNFRAFVDHAWRQLEPGETDVTQVSYESLAGDPLYDRNFQIAFRESADRGLVNRLSMRTFIMPRNKRDGMIERWGAHLDIRAGIRTFIERFEVRRELISGQVLAGDERDPHPVDGGQVRLIVWPQSKPEDQHAYTDNVDGNGEFRFMIPEILRRSAFDEPIIAQVFYHGSARFSPCRSKEDRLYAS